MAYQYESSGPDYHSVNGVPTLANAVSIGVRFKATDNNPAGLQCPVWVGDKDASNVWAALFLKTDGSANNYTRPAPNTLVGPANDVCDGEWHSCVLTVKDETGTGGNLAVQFKIDSLTKATGSHASTCSMGLWDRVGIGRACDSSPDSAFNGLVADVRIWDEVLSDADIDAYIAGELNTDVNTGALVSWWPLAEDADDDVGTLHLTGSGSPVLADDPWGTGVTITKPSAYQVYQRNGSNKADITIEGTYSGSPTAIEARWNGGAWTTIDSTLSGGTFSGTLSNQDTGQGTLEVRFANDTGITDSVAYVGIGDVFLVAGQSNAAGRGTSNQTYSHATLKASKFAQTAGVWAELADPSHDSASAAGSVWPLLATLHMADQSVPVAFITAAVGATGLYDPTHWQDGQTVYDAAVTQVTAAKVNAVKAVLWHQGEQDAFTGVSRANYNAQLDTLISQLRAEGGALADTVLVAAQIGEVNTATDATTNAIRLAISDAWDDNALIYPGPVLYDINTDDGVHFKSNDSLSELADRWWAAIDEAFFGGTAGRGPKLSATRWDGTSVTLTFDRDLTSEAILSTGAFIVKDDGTPATISGAATSGTRDVVLTLSTEPTGTVTASLGNGDDAGGLTVPTGATGLPAEPFIDEEVPPITTPTVTTAAASSITATSASTGGNVTADGGATVTERGVCYGTSENPTVDDNYVQAASGGTGAFTVNLSGLVYDTLYYIRGTGLNSSGRGYATQASFRTLQQFTAAIATDGVTLTLDWRLNGRTWANITSDETKALTLSVDGSAIALAIASGTLSSQNSATTARITFTLASPIIAGQVITVSAEEGVLFDDVDPSPITLYSSPVAAGTAVSNGSHSGRRVFGSRLL